MPNASSFPHKDLPCPTVVILPFMSPVFPHVPSHIPGTTARYPGSTTKHLGNLDHLITRLQSQLPHLWNAHKDTYVRDDCEDPACFFL